MNKLLIRKTDQAVSELCKADPAMNKLVNVVGDIKVTLRTDYFNSLVRSMIGQQISVAAASAIYNRLNDLMGQNITAEGIQDTADEALREIGLSARKVVYLRDLAHKIVSSELNLDTLHTFENPEVIKKLTSIKGIGKWTAEMFLIFSLGRMNVLAVDDIGIQRGAKWLYQVDKSERRKILEEKAAIWEPHLTTASFYLWEVVHLDFEKRFASVDEIETQA